MFKAKLISVVAGLVGLTPLAESAQAQQTASVCMSKMTQGKPGGDHRFTLVVAPERESDLKNFGFEIAKCGRRKESFSKLRKNFCQDAGFYSVAIDNEYRRVYSMTPRELCEITQ